MDRTRAALYWYTLTRLPEVIRFWRNPAAPLEELLEIQMRLLKRRLFHAWEYNPLYRGLMEAANLDRRDIAGMASSRDLQRFPIITKRDLSGPLDLVLSRGYRQDSLIKSNTAGSTGKPLIFYLDYQERFKRRFIGVRNNLNITGCRRNDLYVLLSHFQPIGENEDVHIYKTKLVNQILSNTPSRMIQLSPYKDMDFRRNILEQLRPDILHSWVLDLYSLTKVIKKSSGKTNIRPRLTLCCGGGLPDHMIAEIEETLSTEIRFIYGSREFGDFGAQCHLKQYHLSIDAFVIESVDDQGKPVPPGAPGRLLITDLYNYVTPFIRYEIGDIGALAPQEEKCACGLTLPLLQKLEGRLADCVVDRHGHLLLPSFFWNEWRQEPGIEEAQLIQLDPDHLRLNLVVNTQFSPEASFSRLRQAYTQKMGAVNIDFQFVQELEPEASGKIRMVKSYVPGGRIMVDNSS